MRKQIYLIGLSVSLISSKRRGKWFLTAELTMWMKKPDWGAVPLLPPPPPHSWIGWHLYFSRLSFQIFDNLSKLSQTWICFCFLNYIRNLWGAFWVKAKTTCRPRRGGCTSSWWRLPCTQGTTQAGAPKDNYEEDCMVILLLVMKVAMMTIEYETLTTCRT